jgi:hypothetical protein
MICDRFFAMEWNFHTATIAIAKGEAKFLKVKQ